MVRVVAVAGLTGAMLLLGGWLLLGSLTTSGLIPPIPRLSSDGPVVRNGVVAIVACGKKRGMEAVRNTVRYPSKGTWAVERKGECSVYFHRPPAPSPEPSRPPAPEPSAPTFPAPSPGTFPAPSPGPDPDVGSNRKPSVLTSDQYDTR